MGPRSVGCPGRDSGQTAGPPWHRQVAACCRPPQGLLWPISHRHGTGVRIGAVDLAIWDALVGTRRWALEIGATGIEEISFGTTVALDIFNAPLRQLNETVIDDLFELRHRGNRLELSSVFKK